MIKAHLIYFMIFNLIESFEKFQDKDLILKFTQEKIKKQKSLLQLKKLKNFNKIKLHA